MKLYTQVNLPRYDFQITTQSRGLVVGSCFATSIGERLSQGELPVSVNPQGVLYNPLSIAQGVELFKNGYRATIDDLVQNNGLWHSLLHHSSFSSDDPQKVLDKINTEGIERLDYIILTLGTAFVYERSGNVVANCHKFPEREFSRRQASIDEILGAIQRVRQCYPNSYILLTVSPIRHLRDGLSANSLSKATLSIACNEFCTSDTNSGYFPSYEIMIDELRDYRFYAADMLHPSPLAIDLIFEKFSQALLSTEARLSIESGARLVRSAAHRSNR